MFSIGKNDNYVRLYPNPGFRIKIWPKRWLHWCHCYGWAILPKNRFCSRTKEQMAKMAARNELKRRRILEKEARHASVR